MRKQTQITEYFNYNLMYQFHYISNGSGNNFSLAYDNISYMCLLYLLDMIIQWKSYKVISMLLIMYVIITF
jgi:hypothetical protein